MTTDAHEGKEAPEGFALDRALREARTLPAEDLAAHLERAGWSPEAARIAAAALAGDGAAPEAAPWVGRASGRVVVIVGGAGGMGRILTRYFETSGAEVRILERGDWECAPKLLAGADLVVVSVPIDVTISVIERLGPMLDETTLLADVTSVKTGPVRAMLAAHKGPVAGLHPMFGPDVRKLDGQVFVWVPARGREASVWLADLIALWGGRVHETSAERHDRAMSIIQALRHFTTYAYGVFLARLNPDLDEILALSSPIYRLELEMVGRLFAQDPHLYADIIMSSEANAELVRSYVESLGPELELVARRDRETFVKRFEAAKAWFGASAEDFMQESGRMLALLQRHRCKKALERRLGETRA